MFKNVPMHLEILILITIPLLGLLAFSTNGVWQRYMQVRDIQALEEIMDYATKASDFVHETQKERGRTAGFLGSEGSKFKTELAQQRQLTDTARTELLEFLDQFDTSDFCPCFETDIAKAKTEMAKLDKKRNQIDRLQLQTPKAIGYYTAMNSILLDLIASSTMEAKNGRVVEGLIAYETFLHAKERAGLERAVLSSTFAADQFSPGIFEKFLSLKAEQEAYTHSFLLIASKPEVAFYNETVSGSAIQAVDKMRAIASEKANEGDFGINPSDWFKQITQKINLLKTMEEHLKKNLKEKTLQIKTKAKAQLAVFSGLTIACIGVTLILGFFMVRGMTKTLAAVILDLQNSSSQVTNAAGEISSASQSLAEGATEQAANFEETASSLEEISSIINQNADNAQQANLLVTETKETADNSSKAMGRMNAAITEIQDSSIKTAKIIKTIDEIAFQTNLLALNAAVEAARAGEAGKGFAVVAEEVRNLAKRSAGAAKETSELIEESVKNSENGAVIAGEVSNTLSEIVAGVGKTTELMEEIAAASQEQSDNIDQINSAMSQMDIVTQSNAAAAEQESSASLELKTQAIQMDQLVSGLDVLVNGAS